MDKIIAVKIKLPDGTYTDQIPLSVLAQNVEWTIDDTTYSITDILGNVDMSAGSIQAQIDSLIAEKIEYDPNKISPSILTATNVQDAIDQLEENFINYTSETVTEDDMQNYVEPKINLLQDQIRNKVSQANMESYVTDITDELENDINRLETNKATTQYVDSKTASLHNIIRGEIDDIVASDIEYDSSSSSLISINVQNAINQLDTKIISQNSRALTFDDWDRLTQEEKAADRIYFITDKILIIYKNKKYGSGGGGGGAATEEIIKNFAGVESSTQAVSQDYEVGQYLINQINLYKVTRRIEQGESINIDPDNGNVVFVTVGEELKNIKDNITGINNDISGINSNITSINNNISSINGHINQVDLNIQSINEDITRIENTEIADLSNEITTLNGNIGSINRDIQSINNNITDINNDINGIRNTDIVNINSRIGNILGDFATIESTSQVSKSYHAGDFLVYNNQLYKVVEDMSIGDLINIGTNVESTSVQTELANRRLWFKNIPVSSIHGEIVHVQNVRITPDYILEGNQITWGNESSITSLENWSTDTPGQFNVTGDASEATTATFALVKIDYKQAND